MIRNRNFVSLADRIMSALSYLSAGWLGLIYCIVLYFAKRPISNFIRFNLTQSIFFALLYFILSVALNFVFGILSHIPLIQVLVAWIQLLFFRPVLWHFSLLQLFINGLILYFVLFSLLGKKPYIRGISHLLDR